MIIFKPLRISYSNLRYFVRNVCVRFAPSPTGQLHLGGMRTAMYNYLFAKKYNGRFILRIEDTDQTRVIPGAVQNLESILKWVGINPMEGPTQGGPYGPYTQSQRLKLYNDSVQQLIDNGSAYRCFCTESRLNLLRKEATRLRQVPKYDNRCKHLTKDEISQLIQKGQKYTVRFSMPEGQVEFDDLVYGPISLDISKIEGDPIILKSDKFPTYHLACVVDDHHMKVTHVLRGIEWQVSTPKHLMLFKAFGWDPPKYTHLPLIMNKDGSKLSKRQNDTHVESIKNNGYYPEAILNFVSDMGGGFGAYCDNLHSLEELVDLFSLEKINVNSCKIDLEKLDYYNKKYLNESIENDERRKLIIDELKTKITSNHQKCKMEILSDEKLGHILLWSRFQGHIITLNDFLKPEFSFIWITPDWNNSKLSLDNNEMAQLIVRDTLELLENFQPENFINFIKIKSKERKLKFPQFMQIIRIGLIGQKEGPGIMDLINLLGVNICTKRLINFQQHYFKDV